MHAPPNTEIETQIGYLHNLHIHAAHFSLTIAFYASNMIIFADELKNVNTILEWIIYVVLYSMYAHFTHCPVQM